MAEWKGKPVGAIGDAGMFSFQSSKNLTAGEGGMIVTNDEKLFQRAWSYHNCGRTLGGEWYDHDFPGTNLRLTELQAALLLRGLGRLPKQQKTRRTAMAALAKKLKGVPGLLVPDEDKRVTGHACHMFMVRLDRSVIKADKMAFVKAMNAEGIPANPGYTVPLYRQNFWNWFNERPIAFGGPAWKSAVARPYADYHLPVCEELCSSTIWIKQDVLLTGPKEMDGVAEAFARVAEAAREGRL
jgi:dTDP-4-amino-4,6-dideoxygalactose transaminase